MEYSSIRYMLRYSIAWQITSIEQVHRRLLILYASCALRYCNVSLGFSYISAITATNCAARIRRRAAAAPPPRPARREVIYVQQVLYLLYFVQAARREVIYKCFPPCITYRAMRYIPCKLQDTAYIHTGYLTGRGARAGLPQRAYICRQPVGGAIPFHSTLQQMYSIAIPAQYMYCTFDVKES